MKWLDLVMVIVSIISLVGSLIVMYVLAVIGEALSALAGAGTAGLGFDLSGIVSTFQFFLVIGWLWVILVFLTSAYTIWVGIKRIRTPAGKK
jgi:hypothetical protein